jgi:hypothetical protein
LHLTDRYWFVCYPNRAGWITPNTCPSLTATALQNLPFAKRKAPLVGGSAWADRHAATRDTKYKR